MGGHQFNNVSPELCSSLLDYSKDRQPPTRLLVSLTVRSHLTAYGYLFSPAIEHKQHIPTVCEMGAPRAL